jgi:hypothetical protein
LFRVFSIYTSWTRPHGVVLPKKEEVIDITTSYIDNKREQFLKTFEPSYIKDMNSSIDSVLYSKKEFQELLKDVNGDIEKQWKTRILFENTPRGNIIMFYDIYKQGFSYYSDNTSIPYYLLNAVAMKYVLLFSCRDFFMDNQVTPPEQPSPLIKIYFEEPKKEEKEKSKKNIESGNFAKFRTYNKVTSQDKIKCVPEKEYNRNIFINLGKMVNFQFIQSTPKKKLGGFTSNLTDMLLNETNLQKYVMSYGDFKKNRAVTNE